MTEDMHEERLQAVEALGDDLVRSFAAYSLFIFILYLLFVIFEHLPSFYITFL